MPAALAACAFVLAPSSCGSDSVGALPLTCTFGLPLPASPPFFAPAFCFAFAISANAFSTFWPRRTASSGVNALRQVFSSPSAYTKNARQQRVAGRRPIINHQSPISPCDGKVNCWPWPIPLADRTTRPWILGGQLQISNGTKRACTRRREQNAIGFEEGHEPDQIIRRVEFV